MWEANGSEPLVECGAYVCRVSLNLNHQTKETAMESTATGLVAGWFFGAAVFVLSFALSGNVFLAFLLGVLFGTVFGWGINFLAYKGR